MKQLIEPRPYKASDCCIYCSEKNSPDSNQLDWKRLLGPPSSWEGRLRGVLPDLDPDFGRWSPELRLRWLQALPVQSFGGSRLVRFGTYFRRSDSKRIVRYRCTQCKRTQSSASIDWCKGQKKRELNQEIYELLVSNVSQRRIAKLLQINRKTVVRKFIFLSKHAAMKNEWDRESFEQMRLNIENRKDELFSHIQLDEMETYEHTKMKPLSVPLIVDRDTRHILDFRVCEMPASGKMARLSRAKYGKRKDARTQTLQNCLTRVRKFLPEELIVDSDKCLRYPKVVKRVFPRAHHRVYKGRKGREAGQGELKVGGYDPLFWVNHTAASIRANISRMIRKTWCTTKKRERLELHLQLYTRFHNDFIQEQLMIKTKPESKNEAAPLQKTA